MDGWTSVCALTRYAFGRSGVVMANEAHNGLARCIRTRETGCAMIRAAHAEGVRNLAMEALPPQAGGTPAPVRAIPPDRGGYLGQPDLIRLISTALELGWDLWAYEAVTDGRTGAPADLLSMEFTNWRERQQAQNLAAVLTALHRAPLLVWAGNAHASKLPGRDWVPMGVHFTALAGEPFVIDQTVSVVWPGQSRDWLADVLAAAADALAAHGGTAAILREQAPEPLDCWPGVDALVVSADNDLT